MFRNITIILTIYSLVFFSCKRRIESSTVKEVPTQLSSFEKVLADGSKEDRALARDVTSYVQELGMDKIVPLVVVDTAKVKRGETPFRRLPKKEEIMGTKSLPPHEELYFGTMDSPYIVNMEIDSIKGRHAIVLNTTRFSTRFVKTSGKLKKDDGKPLIFDTSGNVETLREDMIRKMQALKAFLVHPKNEKSLNEARNRFTEYQIMQIDHKIEENNIQSIITIGAVMVLVPTAAFSVAWGAGELTRQALSQLSLSMKIFVIALVVLLIAGASIIIGGHINKGTLARKKRYLDGKMDELLRIYGDKLKE